MPQEPRDEHGAHVVDGCGEFMPSGEDDTLKALGCTACDRHHNFHWKEGDGEPTLMQQPHFYSGTNNSRGGGALTLRLDSPSTLGGGAPLGGIKLSPTLPPLREVANLLLLNVAAALSVHQVAIVYDRRRRSSQMISELK
ncbi:zinc-finger homeodomain protein 3 [Phtheirospermum japonicum]|uniref:Zinc-finger homeodomain protein 3 n=1 Tax=Phtheirospermum japonicum TaxID=374723 RepID=A0A830CNS1_9LAMI|nr:zinc-finger homeodomain protein 3 [Phtheirospermum japonicum]